MGQGFWVLVWDGWGSGLNMINARLHLDEKGNNSFVYHDGNKEEVIESLGLSDKYGTYWKIIE